MSFWSWMGLADKREISALQLEISFLREENKAFQEQNRKLFEYIGETNKKNLDIIISEVINNREQIEDFIQNTNKRIERSVGSVSDSQTDIVNINKQWNIQINDCIRILNENNRIVSEICDVIQPVFKSECDDIREKIAIITKTVLEKLQKNSELGSSENDMVLREIAKYAEGMEQILFKFQERMDESHEGILNNNQLLKESENQIDKLVTISKQLDQKTDNMDDFQDSLSSLSESVKYLWTIMKVIWVDSVLSDIESL